MMLTSARAMTGVWVEDVLLVLVAASVSVVVVLTVAVLSMNVPSAVLALTVALMTIVSVSAAATVAKVSEPVQGWLVASPLSLYVAPLASWPGSVSLTRTPWASDGPLLLTVRV